MDIRKIDKEMFIHLIAVWATVVIMLCMHAPGICILISIIVACLFTRIVLIYTAEIDKYKGL